ncbi:glucose-specific phosphotransferase system IIA component [Paenibacillus amylolyticus]|uniref:Glucose-specific phosphotransferase system IIA component n=1 Tax=Paenibacillus amylolyticus TaxID=1451 RepID=A0AAP5GVV7_PAEAM|nr:PTS glucose transporter subunit IIA [Paenibacillus amylolyticus]MDR6721554.1 glucose-specific phosphotransferase system IIA component [Paenibacillus amylolyticus]
MFKKMSALFRTEKQPQEQQNTTVVADEVQASVSDEILISPMIGQLIPLSDVKDPAFAMGAMGDGIAIEPKEGKVLSPVDGVIMNAPKSKHSLFIISENGAEILIHVGIDTVKLKGEHFNVLVHVGQQIKAGDLLIEFDLNLIKQSGYEVTTPIIVTNSSNYSRIEKNEFKEITLGEQILQLHAGV